MHFTNACHIRQMESDDLERVLRWRNHPEISRYMLDQHQISSDEHSRWFENVSKDPLKKLLIVEEREQAVGFVQLSNVAVGSVADWGFYAAPESPKGSGRKLGKLALDFAFRRLEVHKVCGQALAFNEASIRFHLKLGFQQEGILRDNHRIGDTYHDLFCFGILGHEWRQ